MAKAIQFSEITLRLEVSSRGGGVEIDLTRFGFKKEKMSAYQNYLGGGMLGKVSVNDSIRSQSFYQLTDKQETKLNKIGERLKKYYHSLTNPDDEFEGLSYEQNQNMSVSAY
jgi:hypothetical protein